jgi:septal ring-binding cell division protein DamX
MNRPYDDNDPPGREYDGQRQRGSGRSDPDRSADREISLGAPAILGIFFALALLCACFFGFGYSMGRKSAQSALSAASDSSSVNADSSGSGSAKPAAGSLASQPAASDSPAAQQATDDSAAPDASPAVAPEVAPAAAPSTPSKNAATPADGMIVGDRPSARPPQPAASNPSAAASSQSPIPAGSFMVQIAAVSSQDVADIELTALKKKGYNVSIRHEPQDKLLHVQIGPFATRKDAQAMCLRVLADGFNAIVK